ncbi:hypothetical protein CDL15_Pgr025516 [Punica granatum]|uniref:Pistil-specific extensin-like protein n=1 Tax=Punica granatum TaxID=22663 RepID=A0A218W9V8_PUNGR|nr:hypothetical protein CDL15_Pgr025516 [Punica granatum]PKI57647.1 hypothetical protein CRG98_021975 [Punica granatum]
MGSKVVLAIIALSVLTGMAIGWGEEAEEIHVGGRVMCQDCTKGWNDWAKGGTPIKGARVSVTCMDERSRITYYGGDDTDEAGRFNMVIDRYINQKMIIEKLCSVRLVSSPSDTCNVPTNFSGGCKGVKLRHPSLVYGKVIGYTVGPLYYTSSMCEEPEID